MLPFLCNLRQFFCCENRHACSTTGSIFTTDFLKDLANGCIMPNRLVPEEVGEEPWHKTTKWGATTLSIMTLSIMALSIKIKNAILSTNDTEHNRMECHFAVSHFNVTLSVIMLNVVMLSVVAPNLGPWCDSRKLFKQDFSVTFLSHNFWPVL